MKVILQRSLQADVRVDGDIVGQIDHGLVALVGIAHGDSVDTVRAIADKTANLRIFPDEAGKMNRNVVEAGGGVLAISQFTLLADCRRGRRPSFTAAAPPDMAKNLYERYADHLHSLGLPVARGIFAADMAVSLVNDGPVTIILDSDEIIR
ncbi:D-aminoacyl-tRNA deacylase [Aporhodopirellula aestuarii]|uniref:D-aminoacyl-tRNA deacylase n=1 Tax=Aporhodopirellula aestuarii TaxID=2950107 RepID=A0ABT0UCR2_9BACT|nr:D-aminoacyl-tRNA deacylase [Aporhodopirellula aestuarii]MCM2374529.1 D-aminoacyl-tRNA deacylase [Aporhodopirellula aestuarii]